MELTIKEEIARGHLVSEIVGRCTNRDEYGNANVNGVDMSFMLNLPYEEMVLITQALNRLADFEDAEIKEDEKSD